LLSASLNGEQLFNEKENSAVEAFKHSGLFLARFCFHDNLAVAGNCRACLIEAVSMEKPIAACVTDLEQNSNF